MVHAVKAYPEYYYDLETGDKTFEVRKNDRPYEVGDILAINEFIPAEQSECDIDLFTPFRKVVTLFKTAASRKVNNGYYTGACKLFKITYILDDPQFCKEGMVILGLKEVSNEPQT